MDLLKLAEFNVDCVYYVICECQPLVVYKTIRNTEYLIWVWMELEEHKKMDHLGRSHLGNPATDVLQLILNWKENPGFYLHQA